MNTKRQWLFQIAVACCVTACLADGGRMPQDAWYTLSEWGGSGSGNGQMSQPYGVVVSPEGLVFVSEAGNHRIQVFGANGEYIRKFGSLGSGNGQLNTPQGIALGPDGLLYVADRGNYRVQVFTQTGTFVRKWGSQGSGNGQFNFPINVAVATNGRVYVADYYNVRVQVFDSNGVFVLKWGSYGGDGGQFTRPVGLAVARNGQIYVTDSQYNETPGEDSGPHGPGRIEVFDASGGYINTWRSSHSRGLSIGPDGLLYAVEGDDTTPNSVSARTPEGVGLASWASGTPYGVSASADGRVYSSKTDEDKILVMSRTYRSPRSTGVVPMPFVSKAEVRTGAPIMDVDYVVLDADSPIVHAELVAFAGGTNSLKNFIKMVSFVEGTGSKIGTNVLANLTNRVAWDLSSDWDTNYIDVSVSVLANDFRGLVDSALITLPANGTNPPMTITQSPITQSEMMPLWYWLLATSDSGITLNGGKIYGTTAPYQGVILAEDTTTTQSGRAYLFGKMGFREATADELNRARTGPSGVVNVWGLNSGTITAGPNDRPRAINEYGFDAGDWGSDAYWMVKQ